MAVTIASADMLTGSCASDHESYRGSLWIARCAVKLSGYGLNDLKPSVVVHEIHC